MPRRREVPKREILPDPVYQSQLLSKFVNAVMKDGKKSTAERIMYAALEAIRERTDDDPTKVFKRAVENVKPALEVKSRRLDLSGADRGEPESQVGPVDAMADRRRQETR